MMNKRDYLKEINELTSKMEKDFPELYSYLNENPITVDSTSEGEMTLDDYKEYLETLKQQLERYQKNMNK